MKEIKAVCFGEVLFDNFPTKKRIGGAPLNVASRLQTFGVKAALISSVGKDSEGNKIINYLNNQGINTSGILIQKEYPTGEVNVMLNDQGVASYDISYPVAWDNIQMLDVYIDLVKQSNLLVFGSLVCRDVVSRNTLKSLLKYAQYKVFDINLRVPHYSNEHLIDLMNEANFIKFNDEELFEISAHLGHSLNSLEQAITCIAKETCTKIICVTKGADGAILYYQGVFYYNTGYMVTVLDTVGSGDSFLAAVLYKIFNGNDPQEAIDFGCAVGALVAGSDGANPILSKKKISLFRNSYRRKQDI